MPTTKKTLDRELGLASVMAISMGAMLGSGIFVLPGIAVTKSGTSLALAYLLSGLIVLPAALCKSELATALPRSGGTYLYVDRSIGPVAGTVVGLGTWFSLLFKSSFALVGLGAYCALLFQMDAESLKWLAMGICAGLVVLNMVGVKKSTKVQNVVVVISLVGLTAFSVLAGRRVDAERLATVLDIAPGDLFATAGLVFVSFAGVTKICSIAEEVRDPGKTLPRGIMASLVVIAAIYATISLVLVGAAPPESFAGSFTPLADVAREALGPTAAAAMAGLAVLTLTSMANSGLLTSSRYPLAMARDNLIPKGLSAISERFRTPIPAILLTGGVMLVLIRFVPVRELAKLASAFQLLVFSLVNATLIVIRESGARWYKPTYRVPLYPITPILGVLGSAGLLATMGRVALLGGVGIVVAGLVWYMVYARRRVDRQGAVSRLYGERRRLSNRFARPTFAPASGVLVPMFERDEDLDTLIPLAGVLANEGCEIEVLRIEEVPDQASLGDFEEEDAKTSAIHQHVDDLARYAHVVCGFEDVVTHNGKHVLFERAVSANTNWIVMRWPERSPWRVFVPDPFAWFLHRPPANLLLFRDDPQLESGTDIRDLTRFRKILVLAEPGPHDSLVVHVTRRLLRHHEAELTFVYLVAPDASEGELAGVRDYHEGLKKLVRRPVGEPKVLQSARELEAIRELSRGYDLLILGAPPEREVRGALRGSFEDRVTERAECAVLRVKATRANLHGSVLRTGKIRQSEVLRGDGFRVEPRLERVEVHDGPRTIRTKGELFAAFARSLGDELSTEQVAAVEEGLLKREETQSTVLSEGVAVPHAVVPGIDGTHMALWVFREPLPFNERGEDPVHMCFLIVGPPGERRDHLPTLARIGQLVLLPGFLEQIRTADDSEAVRRLVREAEVNFVGQQPRGSEEGEVEA